MESRDYTCIGPLGKCSVKWNAGTSSFRMECEFKDTGERKYTAYNENREQMIRDARLATGYLDTQHSAEEMRKALDL